MEHRSDNTALPTPDKPTRPEITRTLRSTTPRFSRCSMYIWFANNSRFTGDVIYLTPCLPPPSPSSLLPPAGRYPEDRFSAASATVFFWFFCHIDVCSGPSPLSHGKGQQKSFSSDRACPPTHATVCTHERDLCRSDCKTQSERASETEGYTLARDDQEADMCDVAPAHHDISRHER